MTTHIAIGKTATVDDPRLPRVRNAEDTVLDLHAEIERQHKLHESEANRQAAEIKRLRARIAELEATYINLDTH